MLKLIRTRRSIRKYTDQPVEKEKITQLLESARLAPSGNNNQPWHFIVVTSAQVKKRLVAAAHNQSWMFSAPVFIVCVADIRARIKEDIDITVDESNPQKELKLIIRDTAIAVEHIVLEACNLGLGTCWVAYFTQEDIRPILNIPPDKYVVCILTVGYPDEIPAEHPRKTLSEIVHYDTW